MRRLETYFENPFDNIDASEDDINTFYSDALARLTQAIANGLPFESLLPATKEKVIALNAAHTATFKTEVGRESLTMTVDQATDAFKKRILGWEPTIESKFQENKAAYHEFYPEFRSTYHHIPRGNIDQLFDLVIDSFTKYKDIFGEDAAVEFRKLKKAYNDACEAQQKMKGSDSSAGTAWQIALKAMSKQAFTNLRAYAEYHNEHPEVVPNYFDQSIVSPKYHPNKDNPGQTPPTTPDNPSK